MLSIGPHNLSKLDLNLEKDAMDERLCSIVNSLRFYPNSYVDTDQIPYITKHYVQSLNGATFKTPTIAGLTTLRMFDLISAEELMLFIGEQSNVYSSSSKLSTTRNGTYLINALSLSLRSLPIYDASVFNDGDCKIVSFWKLTEQGFELEKIECTNDDAEYITYSGCLPGLAPLVEFDQLQRNVLEICLQRLDGLISEDKMGFVAAALCHENSKQVLTYLLNNPELYTQIIENISQNIAQANANQQPLAAKRLECAEFNLQKEMLRKVLLENAPLPAHIHAVWQKVDAINPENTDIIKLYNANQILFLVNTILTTTDPNVRRCLLAQLHGCLSQVDAHLPSTVSGFFRKSPVQQLTDAAITYATAEQSRQPRIEKTL